MTKWIKGIALCGLTGLAVLVSAPRASAQESGAEVWARACGRCHRAQPPNKYDADTWHAIVGHMALNARLTSDEEDAVREFLMGAARRVTMEPAQEPTEPARLASADPTFIPVGAPSNGADLFAKQCAPCHGSEGKGDGPAAVALTPRPPDLTDPERMGKLTDEQLLELLSKGKGAMPGFAALLSPEELAAVLEYVRSLSAPNEQK